MTKTTVKLPQIVKKDFVAWATKATKASLIQSSHCPMERFLITQHKFKAGTVCVGVKHYAVYPNNNLFQRVEKTLPAWAAKFVNAYDNLPSAPPDTTKAEVLALLK